MSVDTARKSRSRVMLDAGCVRNSNDVRMFGAVMSMKEHNAGQVRGPMQLTFARSINSIVPLDSSIVGPAQNKQDVNRADAEGQATNYGTMGRKSTVPYGLYRAPRFLQSPLRRADRC